MQDGETQINNLMPVNGQPSLGATHGRPVLVVFDNNNLNNWHLIVQKETCLGRDQNLEITIQDDTVSRLHARVRFDNIDRPGEEPLCILTDNGSRNGTFLNGRRVSEPERLRSGDRLFLGNVCLIYQVRTELEINNDQKLRAMATMDALTGLMNRGYMAILFQREYERARRYSRPLSVLMLDLDDFKKINDTHGHPTGDVVLENLAREVMDKIRIHDVAGRYGGEEFAVMLPETPLQGGLIMGERLRRAVENMEIRVGHSLLRATVSVGVADATFSDEETLESLIARADQALYRAKSHGKNQVQS